MFWSVALCSVSVAFMPDVVIAGEIYQKKFSDLLKTGNVLKTKGFFRRCFRATVADQRS